MTKKTTTNLIAVLTIATFAFTAPHQKKELIYNVDTKITKAAWLGKKVTGQHEGNISVLSGNIKNDRDIILGGTIDFDMNSITCTDIKEKDSNDQLIGFLKSENFFNVAKSSTAKFEITKVTKQASLVPENDYDVTGKLTIKGITNEINFPAKIKMDDKTIVVIAKIIVNRTKFDIKYGSASFFDKIGDKAISDEFEINLDLVARVK